MTKRYKSPDDAHFWVQFYDGEQAYCTVAEWEDGKAYAVTDGGRRFFLDLHKELFLGYMIGWTRIAEDPDLAMDEGL